MGLFYYFRFVLMNFYCKIRFLLILSVPACNIHAQNADSLSAINSVYDSLLKSDEDAMNVLFYKHKNDALINNIGPYGSPFYYSATSHLYQKDLIEPSDPFNDKYFQLTGIKPFTNITYVNASRKEQLFSIKHAQQFGKLLTLNFDLRKISSPGAYINQEANNAFFKGTLKYKSKKDNYEVMFSNGIKRNFYEENGGLEDIEDYEISRYDNERTYAVNLETSNAFIKKYDYQLMQRLDIFKIKSDSLTGKIVYLKHQINYSTQQRVFYDNDPNSDIYENTYLSSISSIDSIYHNNFSNTGTIGLRSDKFSFELFSKYEQREYEQSFGISSSYHNTYAGFSTGFKNATFNADVMAKYGIDGYRKNDMESELLLLVDKGKYVVNGKMGYYLNEPDLNYLSYTSNHFIWTNLDMKKQSIIDLGLDFNLKKYQLTFSAEIKLLNNTLYFDSLAQAAQDNNTNSIATFLLAKNYKLLNFHFRTAFIYQITSDKLLFPLPDIVGRQIFYYEKYIFKGALKIQLGVGASYSTEYYGYAYMPAIGEFYVQQNTKLGYYPSVDVFLNTHLKRAQIFLKYEHINNGSLQKSYAVPGYPPMNKSLKLGVSWNLFD